MKNGMVDLRNHLFATLEGLLDPDSPMALDRAKTVADVAQVLVNSAKVEAEFLRTVGDLTGAELTGTGFIPAIGHEELPVPRLVNGGRV
ncbi:MAG: hypothetical protein KBG29_01540 [Pseudomonadales bacterium]|nr:hypothetical protein [Pseudomonadales bacterium]